jgi:nucleoside-diphosphate-sugar epimerase
MNNYYTIFGNTGFIGNNLLSYCKKKKYKVFLPKKGKYIYKKNLGHIIYCMGTGEAKINPIKAFKANLLGVIKIIFNNKFDSFTYISTTRVYLFNKNSAEDKERSVNVVTDEGSLFNLLKLSAEKILIQSKKNIKIIRLTNVYGKFFSKQKYLLPNLIRNSLIKKKIIISINKNSLKDYLHIDEAMPFFFKIINKSKYKIYNIAGSKRYKIKDIANEIKKNTSCEVVYENQKLIINDQKININRIKREFNFNPKRNLLSDLKIIIKDIRSRL